MFLGVSTPEFIIVFEFTFLLIKCYLGVKIYKAREGYAC